MAPSLVMDVGSPAIPAFSPVARILHNSSRRTKKLCVTTTSSSIDVKIRLAVQTLVSKKHASFQSNSRAVALYQAGKIIPIPALHKGMRQFQ